MFQQEGKNLRLNVDKKWSACAEIGVIIQFVDLMMIDIVNMFLKQRLKLCGSSSVVTRLNKQCLVFAHTLQHR